MTITPRPNRLLLTLLAWGLALAAGLTHGTASASDEYVYGTLTVSTPDVVIGERARVEVELPPGADFDLIVAWGDGATDRVDRFGSLVQTFEHAYATAGTKLVTLAVDDFNATFVDSATIDVAVPALTLAANATVGETLVATIRGGPVGGTLDWGDGRRTEVAAGDSEPEHAYAAAGTYVAQLEDALGNALAFAVVVVRASATSSLSLSTSQVLLGEIVTATVSDAPTGATLDWGDGRRGAIAGAGAQVDHAYASVGAFVVRLLDADGAVLDLATIGVVRGLLRVDLPSRADVGAPAEVEIAGLESNAPSGARLSWGDGSFDVVTADGVVGHAYARAGSYLIRLTDLASGTPLAVGLVVVEAGGSLALDGAARLFGPTVWVAAGLAPGLTYEIALGDGTVVTDRADAGGGLRVEHRYTQSVASVDATLTLIDGGQRLPLATVRATLELPVPSETLVLRAIPRVAEGRIDVEIEAGGLLPGLPYVVGSPSLGWQAITGDAGGAASATFATAGDLAGTVEVVLAARLPFPQGGVDERERARASASVGWPRGSEALAVDAAETPILVSDTVRLRASGLVPGYAYELVVAGDAERPYRLTPATETEWSIDLPMAFFGPRFDVELVARYPLFAQFGPGETRASVTLEPLTPTGSLALGASIVPFAVPTPLRVGDLTPGVPYRVEVRGDVVARFVGPAEGAIDLLPALRSTAAIDLRVDRAFADIVPVASVSPSGVTFAGSLGFTYDPQRYFDDGEVTLQVRGAAAEQPHVVVFSDGRRFEGTTNAEGALDLTVTDPGGDAFLRIQGFDREYDVARTRFDTLPPRVLRFHGGTWRVRVTQLDAPFEAPNWTLSGRGVLEDFVIGGRLQDPVPMAFDALRVFTGGTVRSGFAELAGPWSVQLPQAVRGVELTLTRLTLQLSGQPQLNGSVALPTGERSQFDNVMFGTARPESGFMVSVLSRGDGRALGASGWTYQSNGFAVLDLSTESNYNLTRPDGRFALDHAYAGWTEVGRSSPAATQGGRWVGVIYPDAELRLSDAGSRGDNAFVGDLAWTTPGASAYVVAPLGDANGNLALGGWTFRDVTGLELLVIDDQVVRFTRARGTVRLDWFGQDVPVAFQPLGASWTVHTLAPVAQDFGSTAVVGGVGTFVRTGLNRLSLRFPNALWALDGDLAADPATIDTTQGDALMASLASGGEATQDIRTLYADSVATAETALNLYRLQLLLKDLTLHPDGAVDLGGRDWRTLARIPALDMFGFPYLGAGAEIGVRSDGGGTYRIGLRGDLKLGDVIEATAAPSWLVHRDGRATQWRFEGVGAKFGDYEGSQVKFSLVVGGVIDLERDALSFTGGGSLTISEVISIEAMALFGVVEPSGPNTDYFWFVTAGVDLGEMQRPINVKVNGVDVLAFYVFRGGIASNLRIDVGGGNCRVDNGNVPEGRLPSIAANALDCYDPNLDLSLLAGTVIGSPAPSGMPPDGYGKLWHLDADLVVNLGRGGDLQLAGKGWLGLNLAEGYRRRAIEQPQLAGRLVINAAGITGSMCAGPLASAAGVLDCSRLAKAEVRVAGVLLAELRGAIEFKASWSQRQYYFALGTVRNPLYMYVIPRYSQAYFIIGYITDPGILHANVRLPAGGVWIGAQTGFRFDYEKSGKALACNYRVYAGANFGYGGALGLQAVPRFQITASVTIHASARAGGRVCGKGLDVSASLRATGTLRAPSPTEFRGDIHVKIKLPVVPDIDVTVRDRRLALN